MSGLLPPFSVFSFHFHTLTYFNYRDLQSLVFSFFSLMKNDSKVMMLLHKKIAFDLIFDGIDSHKVV